MKMLFKLISHTLIVLSLVFLVMEILDWYNPYMNFMGLDISICMMLAFCLLALLQSVHMLYCGTQEEDQTRQSQKLHPPPPSALKGLPALLGYDE